MVGSYAVNHRVAPSVRVGTVCGLPGMLGFLVNKLGLIFDFLAAVAWPWPCGLLQCRRINKWVAGHLAECMHMYLSIYTFCICIIIKERKKYKTDIS